MDAVLLARIQFALTIGFHYLFPPLTIGMAWLILWFQSRHLMTKDELYFDIARFWTKLFAISFAIGVASGIVMEFQFGTNWAAYSRFVGDIFGPPLAAEGVIAFFLESSFLGIMLYGEKKVSRKTYWFASLMVAFGATLSAFWIIAANSWQQTPAGFVMANGRAELVDFWAAVFNPTTIIRYTHSVIGALLCGAFFIMGISAWYLSKKRHLEFARRSFKSALWLGFASTWLILYVGHTHGVQVYKYQPAKLAAFEGLWETTDKAPLLLFGIPDSDDEKTHAAIGIPGFLSLLIAGDTNAVIKGLKEFPPEDRPPVLPSFLSFHAMLGSWAAFVLITSVGLWLTYKKRLESSPWFLTLCTLSIPIPFIANEVGWMAAEIGRQPWVVYGMMRTKDAVSATVSSGEILFSLLLFGAVYLLLFVLWIFLLKLKVQKGPELSQVK